MASETSPSASFTGLPTSKTIQADNSARLCSIKSPAVRNILARSFTGVLRHAGKAAFAAAIAAVACSTEISPTLPITSL